MKKITYIFLFALICFSAFAKEPLWYSEDGLEEIYPNETYIAEVGYGKNVQLAESDALEKISRFFNTSISSQMKTRESFIDENGDFYSNESIDTETVISTEVNLFAVEYSKPYVDKKLKQTAVVAYIDRNKAWNIYEPKLKSVSDSFEKQYNLAQKQSDKLKKYFLLNASKQYVADFIQAYEFGLLINPYECKNYDNVNKKVSSVPVELNKLKMNCVFSLKLTGDKNDIIKRKITSRLSEEGFVVQNSNAPYLIDAKITSEINQSSDEFGTTFTSYPGIEIVIQKDENVFFSYSKTYSKTVAFNQQKNITMSFQKLEKDLDENFINELNNFLSAK